MCCGWSALLSMDNMLEQSCRMVLGFLPSFWGEMDVLHPEVSSGWLNAATFAHGWGLWTSFGSSLLFPFYDTYI